MSFTEIQTKLLGKDLDRKNVKQRSQGGGNVSYIEGWHAINEANRIFGFDGWSRETVYLKEACRYEKITSSGKTQVKVAYEAKVRISAGGITREGTGHGSGQMGDLADAIESAAKEAETDAMKRALMTFGYPFGLALYDKRQEHISANVEVNSSAVMRPDEPDETDETNLRYFDACMKTINAVFDEQDIRTWWKERAKERGDMGITQEQHDRLLQHMKTRFEQIRKMELA